MSNPQAVGTKCLPPVLRAKRCRRPFPLPLPPLPWPLLLPSERLPPPERLLLSARNTTAACGQFRLHDNKQTNPIAVGDWVEFSLEPDGTGVITQLDEPPQLHHPAGHQALQADACDSRQCRLPLRGATLARPSLPWASWTVCWSPPRPTASPPSCSSTRATSTPLSSGRSWRACSPAMPWRATPFPVSALCGQGWRPWPPGSVASLFSLRATAVWVSRPCSTRWTPPCSCVSARSATGRSRGATPPPAPPSFRRRLSHRHPGHQRVRHGGHQGGGALAFLSRDACPAAVLPFANCTHRHEPHCAVKEAVSRPSQPGTLRELSPHPRQPGRGACLPPQLSPRAFSRPSRSKPPVRRKALDLRLLAWTAWPDGFCTAQADEESPWR